MPRERAHSSTDGVARQRVGINAHLLSGTAGYRRAGIHQYIDQVLRHLPWTSEGPDYVVFTRQAKSLSNRPGITVSSSRWPTERRLVRILWEQTAWPYLAATQNIRLLHSMAFVTPVWSLQPAVLTVYDLSFVYYPDRFPPLQRLYLTSQTARSCRNARRIITISESGRQDVHRFFGVPIEQIDVIRPGVEDVFRPLPEPDLVAFRQRKGLPERFLLHVGTLQPRKNIPILLEALAQLRRPDLPLVLAGGKGWLYDEIFARIEALGLQRQVLFTGYVSDEELPLWYNAATLLVFPSVYEGFGMPVVEAMACGTPVIASNTSSIPEAAGEAALLFSPQDSGALAEHIAFVLDDAVQSATMRERGLCQARRFSWAQTGQETAAVYHRILKDL